MAAYPAPKDIQLIGGELCIVWADGREDYFPAPFLRAKSPSAENIGERDILGQQYGGDGPKEFPNAEIATFNYVGNYAIRISFADGHSSGIYSWEYLRKLGENREVSS